MLEQFDLVEAGGKLAMTYSGGMKRRLDLAMTLVGNPRIIFLDEPTTGLDPRSRHSMWSMIRELVASGVTVLLTTQYLEEADQLADRIAVLDQGRLVAQGTPAELKRLVPGGHVQLRFNSPDEFTLAGQVLPTALPNAEALILQVPNDGSVHALRDLLARIDDASLDVSELTVHTPDLDDVFFAVTNSDQKVSPLMSTYAVADTATLLRRNLRHSLRYPSLAVGAVGMPIIMLLLFGLVFGDTFSAGLGGGFDYIDFLTPGLLLMSIASGTMSPAIGAAVDMTEGIVARFRTMAIYRPAVLTGHVLGNVILTVVSLALVVGFAVLIGFRPNASIGDWLLAAGLLILVTIALTWFAIALGLISKTAEGASNIVLPISFVLPFLSNTFLPLESMPSGIRWFAEYQPFTPIIDSLRHLLLGTPMESGSGWLAVAWCIAITIVGYFWAQKSYNKGTAA